jgi:4-hydroxyphenylacetate 3-monooxygenase/chlorophenol-4-monooxygenase component 2
VLGKALSGDAALWAAIPVSSAGISLVMREPTVRHGSSREHHPVDSNGEEIDQIMIFDDVFLPREYVFSLHNLELPTLYHESCRVRALAHHDPPRLPRRDLRRDRADAQTLRAYSPASIERAVEWCGVQVPSPGTVAAGRLYSITEYPKIMYLIQDMCGQGLVSRWPEKVWDHPEFGPRLAEYLPGADGVTAREKNNSSTSSSTSRRAAPRASACSST